MYRSELPSLRVCIVNLLLKVDSIDCNQAANLAVPCARYLSTICRTPCPHSGMNCDRRRPAVTAAFTGVRIELFVAQNDRRAAFWEFESARRSLDLNTISSGLVALLRSE